VGCASLSDGPDGGPVTTVACGDNLTEDDWLLDWELTVMPTQEIVAGEDFSASIDGVAKLSEAFLDRALTLIEGRVQELNLAELNATVHVYDGASGADVTLTADSAKYEYECELDGAECDPANRNDDCEQGFGPNRCGRFVPLPTSHDCNPGGFCESRGKTQQCELNDFCISGDLEIELGEETGQYTASPGGGEVLWGWADTGFEVRDRGPNEGTWILPMPAYSDPTGPISLRVLAGVFPVALECTMGVDCKGPYGVGCVDSLSSPTPKEALIAHPSEPAF